jgi:hypothetical protein
MGNAGEPLRNDWPSPIGLLIDGQPFLYECPLCGELPHGCECLRPSVRRRIAQAIDFPRVPDRRETPFLVREPEPHLDPPGAEDGLTLA